LGFAHDRGSPCGGALHLAQSGLATAAGAPVGDPFPQGGWVVRCVGTHPLVGDSPDRWELRDGDTGAVLWAIAPPPHAELLGAWETDGEARVAFSDDVGRIHVVGPGAPPRSFATPAGAALHGRIDARGTRAAVWLADRPGLWMLDLATGKALWSVSGECGRARGDFTGDGARVVLVDAVCGLRVVDAATGSVVRTLRDSVGPTANIDVVDTKVFLHEGTMWQIWDAVTGERTADWRAASTVGLVVVGREIWWLTPDGVGHRTPLDAVNVGVPGAPEAECATWIGDRAGRRWGCSDERDGGDALSVWDDDARRWIATLTRGPAGLGRSLPAFGADGRRVAFGGADGFAQVWEPGREAIRIPGAGAPEVRVARLSPDGIRVASAGGREVRISDAASGAQLATIPTSTLPLALDWSPDGTRLAVALGDGTVDVLDTATWVGVPARGKHGGYTKAVAWDREGKRLISGGGDGTVLVRASPDADPVTLRPGFAVLDARFGPGPWVTITGFGGPVQVWDPEDAALVSDLGHAAKGPWVSADGAWMRYVLGTHWQAWRPERWAGTAAELSRRVRCEVPLQMVGTQVVERREPCPEG
jgi:hypothetical protein